MTIGCGFFSFFKEAGERQKVGVDPSSLERWLKHPPSKA